MSQISKEEKAVEVIFEKGEYFVDETIEISDINYSLNLKGRYSNEVVITSGKRIFPSEQCMINGMKTWVFDIPRIDGEKWCFHKLFVDGTRRSFARIPHTGYYRMKDVPLIDKTVSC